MVLLYRNYFGGKRYKRLQKRPEDQTANLNDELPDAKVGGTQEVILMSASYT